MNILLICFLLALVVGFVILQKVPLTIGMGILTAFLVGCLADAVVPGKLPGGVLGAVMAGWLGFILGHKLLGNFGPHLGGVYVLPAFLGAVVIAFVAELHAQHPHLEVG